MQLPNLSIRHPVITIILNIMIVIIGFLSLDSLQVREYPAVHIPQVRIYTYYPNASAEIVENAVTNQLEDLLAGVEGVDTITSESKYGISQISLIFRQDSSIDSSLLAIREAIGLAELPDGVKTPVIERKASDGMPFIIISLEAGNMDGADLTHYANLNFKNIFRSLKGVASVQVWGQSYTYKVVLDHRKMYAFGVNDNDIFEALKNNRRALPAGKLRNEIPVTLSRELKTIEDFENLWIKDIKNSSVSNKQTSIYLKHIADVRLETDNEKFRVRINGKPGLSIAINKTSDGNPLEVSRLVRQQISKINPSLPSGMTMKIISDKAEFIEQSIYNVKKSVLEAVICVLGIVFLFLRNIRATIVPLITIPISLLGSFIFLKVCSFSINLLTLLAMVLAIGLVVDDAIVVLENIQRYIEKGMGAFEAALKGSREIGFAIVAMTLTLTSVYMPLAFIHGTVGNLFIEFAVTLAGSVLVSGVVALTLSPLMCAYILHHNEHTLWPQLDRFMDQVKSKYSLVLRQVLDRQKMWTCVLLASSCATLWLAQNLPTETIPKEDRSLIGVYVPPIAGKNIETIEKKLAEVEEKIGHIKEERDRIVFIGDWGGNIILPLKHQSKRKHSAQQIVDKIQSSISTIPSVDLMPWSYDTGLPGIERTFDAGELSLVISTTSSYQDLFDTVNKAAHIIEKDSIFKKVHQNLKLDTPQYRVILNTYQMDRLNIKASQIAKILEIFFSSDQTQTFFKDGIAYAITFKGYLAHSDINNLYITNDAGKRISIGALAELVPSRGPESLPHYNQMRSLKLSTEIPHNISFGDGMKQFLEQVNKQLPEHFKKTWIGKAKALDKSKQTMLILFILAVIFVYAIMAVQFENFLDPFIILLTVPLACLGGLILVWMVGGSVNIYTQIGLITLIGLITKHGILIVSFVNQQSSKLSLQESVIQAASLRLRPILMTTAAMIFGAIPLVLSGDAGYETRQAIGIVLLGGLFLGTVLTLFVLPSICYGLKMMSIKLSFIK